MGSSRVPIERFRVQVCEAAAVLLCEGGADVLSLAAVSEAVGVTRSRLLRAYADRAQLMTGIHTHGHARIAALCQEHPRRGSSGLQALVMLIYDLVEQVAGDPLVRAVHVLESTDYAADPASGSVYRLWDARFAKILLGSGTFGVDPMLADTAYRRVADVVEVLMASVAGVCLSGRWSPSEIRGHADRMHMVLQAVVPALCTDADHIGLYLAQVHHYALDSICSDRSVRA